MAYISGTAFSAADLITALTSFCTANGWTVSSGVLSKGSVHVRPALAGTTRYFVKLEIGDTAGFASPGQLGVGWHPYINLQQVWPVFYRIFDIDDGDGGFTVIMSVLEANQVDYEYLAFGFLANKVGTWAGGEWIYGTHGSSSDPAEGHTASPSGPGLNISNDSGGNATEVYQDHHGLMFTERTGGGGDSDSNYPNTILRCDLETVAPFVGTNIYPPDNPDNAMGMMRMTHMLIMRGKNLWNQESCLVPIHVFKYRASATMSRLGTVCGVRFMRLDNYENGDIIPLGSDRWMVLPCIKRNVANPGGTTPAYHGWGGDSGSIAYAIKYDGP